MNWNYRIFRENDGGLAVREVFYGRDGKIIACSDIPVELSGESIEDLNLELEWFKEAMSLPVLTLADVPQQSAKKRRGKDRKRNVRHEALLERLGIQITEQVTS